MPDPKLTFVKFDSLVCGPCIAMNKKGLLKDLARERSNVTVIDLTILDSEGEANKGTAFGDAYDLSDEYDVQSTPTTIVLNEEGIEVARAEAPIMRVTDMEKLYAEAVKNAEAIISARALWQRTKDYVQKFNPTTHAKQP